MRISRRLLFWLAPLIVLVLIFSSVVLFAPAWHLLHGNFLAYEGWHIPVPPGFYVARDSGGPSLVHLSVGTLPWGGPSADIHFSALPPGEIFKHSTKFEGFAAGAAKAARDGGYLPLDHKVASTGGGTAYCVEFASPGGGARAYIQCAVEGSGLFILYMGSSGYKPQFYHTLKNMRLHHDATAGP